ncbi:MAG: conjugal transfer protein TraG N-terminal domain-containing protein, partial [Holosporaceae bacterium]|nr:conjugal transfer protein TraG N-terminal domain-containing protein [Holosporaceae bacterium]
MEIYTIGGGEIVYEVLKSVALCLNGGNGTLQSMLTIGGIFAAFMVYFMILYGNVEQILRTWALPLMLMLYMLFLPTTSVWIKDSITKYHYKIDNVPYGLAIFASNVSRIGHALTEMVEQNFSTPDDLKYQKSGMMFGSDILEKSKTFKIVSPNFRENMRNFVGQCVKYDIMLNGKYSFEELRNSSDLWGLISAHASQNRGIFWIPL